MTIEELDKEEALRYLGGKDLNGEIGALLSECEQRLLKVLTPRYVYSVYGIEPRDDGLKLSGSVAVLTGNDIKEHLAGCERAVLLCATAGQGTDRLIRELEAKDVAKAAVTDSLASVAAEQICDRAEREIFSKLPAAYKTERFSPGYGDLPLTLQPSLLTLCDAERKIGLRVTDSLLLTPRKSITAVIGISDTPRRPRHGKKTCESCPASENCKIRLYGGHCGKEDAE